VAGVDGRRLIRPTLVFYASGSSPETILTAREAELRRNPEENTLSILLTDGMAERGNDVLFAFDGQQEGVVPLLDDGRGIGKASSPSHLPFRQIPREVKKQEVTLAARRRSMATLAAGQMLTGRFDELTGPDWTTHENQMTEDQHRLKHLQAVPWRRWATGFSCLFFAMVGVPLAIHIRSANLFTTFAACFLPLLLVYYPLLVYGVDRTKCGALPPYAVWLGNAICGVVGFLLLRRVLRR
jgi:lipopolysaccharide export system permease protein